MNLKSSIIFEAKKLYEARSVTRCEELGPCRIILNLIRDYINHIAIFKELAVTRGNLHTIFGVLMIICM